MYFQKGVKMKIYEFSSEFQTLKNMVENELEFNEETGEIIDNSEEIAQLFKELEMKFGDKLDSVMRFVSMLDGQADTLDKEIKRLQAKKKSLNNKVDNLKLLVKNSLIDAGIDKFSTDLHSFSFRKSESVEVDNIELLDSCYVRIKKEADKNEIKKAIKSGIEVNGASIASNTSLIVK